MEKNGVFTVKMSDTDESGSFLCPSCGKKISPEDASLKDYAIRCAYFTDEEKLVVAIYCFCGANINLVE